MWLKEGRIEGGQDLELDQEAGSKEEGEDQSAAGGGIGAQKPPVTMVFRWQRRWWWHAAGSTRGSSTRSQECQGVKQPTIFEASGGQTCRMVAALGNFSRKSLDSGRGFGMNKMESVGRGL